MADIDTAELLRALCSVMSVTGSELRGSAELKALVLPFFDEYRTDAGGSHIFIKRCQKSDAPRLLIDTHFDEIGMLVTEIHDAGYLGFTSMGGLDLRTLPASEVVIYGSETIHGVITAVPPHLQKPGDSKKVTPLDKLYIDTGYTKERLEKIVSVGTPVGFYGGITKLLGTRVCGRSFDNKACCAAAIKAAAAVTASELACDLFAVLSSREEESLVSGAATAAYAINPDAAIVSDVTFASFPGVDDFESGDMGAGHVLSLSASTDRRLTLRLRSLCEKNGIPVQTTVDAINTGTNATMLTLCGSGIPCAVASVPLSAMHTASEIIDISDVEGLAELLRLAMTHGGIFE